MFKSTDVERPARGPSPGTGRRAAQLLAALLCGFMSDPAWSQAKDLLPKKTAPPDAATAARHGTVQQFALAVARARVPVGIFLPPEDPALGSYIDPSELETRAELPDDALGVFAEVHRDYGIVGTASEGLVIVPKGAGPCVSMAKGRLRTLIEAGPAIEILYRLHRTWSDETSPYVPPGLLGNEDRDYYLAPVSMSVVDGSLESALNELVRQVPGLGWSIRDEGRESCSLGLFTGRSWIQALDWTVPAGPQER